MTFSLISHALAQSAPTPAPTPTLVALIAHARGVPSALRETFAAECAALEGNPAVLILRTCHRVEVYVAIAAFGEEKLPTLPPMGLRLEDADAARHLISVACGLESAVIGEDQVLHQVREAFIARRSALPLDPALHRLFQIALSAGRQAHSWFAGEHRSLGDAALNEIERRVATLRNQPILVVGAGSMGRLTAKAAIGRGAHVIVTSRTPGRAASLARDINGEALVCAVDGTLPPVAGVVIALSGIWDLGVLDAHQLAEGSAIVVDLSSPPAVSGALQAQLGDRFLSIDDLAWGPQIQLPEALRNRLDQLVTDSGREYCRWLRARFALPTIQKLTDAAEERRGNELKWLAKRMPEISDADWALIDQMSHRLMAGILHAPRSVLRREDNESLDRAARELFEL